MTLKLGMQHWVLEYYQVCLNNDPGLTLTYFTARSDLDPYAFVWEKGKTMGAVCSLPRGYIHVLNHEKMYKIRH